MRPPIRPIPRAAGLAAAALLLATGSLLLGGRPAGPVSAQAGPPPCAVDKVAAPAVLPLGYSTRVTLTVRASCVVSGALPTNLVLVLDSSGSMQGEKNAALKRAAKQLVRDLKLDQNPQVMVSIITFSSAARTLCKLTNDSGRLLSCIGKIDANGGTVIDAGILAGMRELLAGRPHGLPAGSLRERMIVLTDGVNNAGCTPVERAAAQAKGQGVVLSTVALGSDSDQACMQSCASASHFHWAATAADLYAIFRHFLPLVVGPLVERLRVDDQIPANMRLEWDTLAPPTTDGDESHLIWDWLAIPPGDYRISYALTPLELGEHPVNVAAEAEILADGRAQGFVFPLPRVRVIDLPGLPTPTRFPTLAPTPTFTPWPSDTPGPTASARPTATLPPPTVTPTPPAPLACPGLTRLAPPQAVAAALANPAGVAGWGERCNPGLPPGPMNPLRTTLGLEAPGKPYHPLFNGLAYKCGCP